MSKISTDHLDRGAYVYVRHQAWRKFNTIMKASGASTACGSGHGCWDGRM